VASGTEATGDSRAGALGEPTRARSAGDGRSPQPNDCRFNGSDRAGGSNSPAAQRLATHPGVGTLTAVAFVLIIREVERFHCGNQVASYLGLVPFQRKTPVATAKDWDTSASKATACYTRYYAQEQRGQTFQNKQPLPASQAAPVCLSRSAASRSSENFVSLLRHAGPATCDQRGRLRQTR
jgi:Transposase IS116/IS110/IS902 family